LKLKDKSEKNLVPEKRFVTATLKDIEDVKRQIVEEEKSISASRNTQIASKEFQQIRNDIVKLHTETLVRLRDDLSKHMETIERHKQAFSSAKEERDELLEKVTQEFQDFNQLQANLTALFRDISRHRFELERIKDSKKFNYKFQANTSSATSPTSPKGPDLENVLGINQPDSTSSNLSETDRIKAKAAALLAQRMAALNIKSPATSTPSRDSTDERQKRLEEIRQRIENERSQREQTLFGSIKDAQHQLSSLRESDVLTELESNIDLKFKEESKWEDKSAAMVDNQDVKKFLQDLLAGKVNVKVSSPVVTSIETHKTSAQESSEIVPITTKNDSAPYSRDSSPLPVTPTKSIELSARNANGKKEVFNVIQTPATSAQSADLIKGLASHDPIVVHMLSTHVPSKVDLDKDESTRVVEVISQIAPKIVEVVEMKAPEVLKVVKKEEPVIVSTIRPLEVKVVSSHSATTSEPPIGPSSQFNVIHHINNINDRNTQASDMSSITSSKVSPKPEDKELSKPKPSLRSVRLAPKPVEVSARTSHLRTSLTWHEEVDVKSSTAVETEAQKETIEDIVAEAKATAKSAAPSIKDRLAMFNALASSESTDQASKLASSYGRTSAESFPSKPTEFTQLKKSATVDPSTSMQKFPSTEIESRPTGRVSISVSERPSSAASTMASDTFSRPVSRQIPSEMSSRLPSPRVDDEAEDVFSDKFGIVTQPDIITVSKESIASPHDFSAPFMVLKAQFEYKASSQNELSFKQGTYITVPDTKCEEAKQLSFLPQGLTFDLDKKTDWWYGRLQQGCTAEPGYFPVSYVETVADLRGSVREAGRKPFEAIYPYSAQQVDEINLASGMVLIVLNDTNSQWWQCVVVRDPTGGSSNALGIIGICPATYLKPYVGSEGAGEPDNDPDAADVLNPFLNPASSEDMDVLFQQSGPAKEQSPIGNDFSNPSVRSAKKIGHSRQRSRTVDFGTSSAKYHGPLRETWTQCVDQELLSNVTNEERKRQEAIYELIATERSYMSSLAVILEVGLFQHNGFAQRREYLPLFGPKTDF
jgi:hypothetical protein